MSLLRSRLFQRVSLGVVHRLIDATANDPDARARAFSVLSDLLTRRLGFDDAPSKSIVALSQALIDCPTDEVTLELSKSLLRHRTKLALDTLKSIPDAALEGVSSAVLESHGKFVDALVLRHPEAIASRLETLPQYGLRRKCYSQEGEDLVLARIFEKKSNGFFVDVGAHHPLRFSNTYLLYCKGWHGINIDATPDSMRQFQELRPRDINIECLVSSKEDTAKFFLFNEPALNTSSRQLADQRSEQDNNYHVAQEVELLPRRLDSILNEYLAPGQSIDLLNVDVEGSDFDVLHSNDWTRYRPAYVLVELLGSPGAGGTQDKILEYMTELSYTKISRFFNTALFKSDL